MPATTTPLERLRARLRHASRQRVARHRGRTARPPCVRRPRATASSSRHAPAKHARLGARDIVRDVASRRAGSVSVCAATLVSMSVRTPLVLPSSRAATAFTLAPAAIRAVSILAPSRAVTGLKKPVSRQRTKRQRARDAPPRATNSLAKRPRPCAALFASPSPRRVRRAADATPQTERRDPQRSLRVRVNAKRAAARPPWIRGHAAARERDLSGLAARRRATTQHELAYAWADRHGANVLRACVGVSIATRSYTALRWTIATQRHRLIARRLRTAHARRTHVRRAARARRYHAMRARRHAAKRTHRAVRRAHHGVKRVHRHTLTRVER